MGDGYQRGLPSIVNKFCDRKSTWFADKSAFSGAGKIKIMSTKKPAEELYKPIFRKFHKRKSHSSFIGNICSVDLANMELLTKFNKGTCSLLCLIDIYGKYAWVNSVKNKKSITITNALQKILDKSNGKRNKIWVDNCSEFSNTSMESWLEKII